MGLRGLRPCVFPTPTSGAWPLQAMPAASWSRLWRSLRPADAEYRLIRARRLPPCRWVRRAPRRGLVVVLRLRETLWRSMGHVARRRDCAAFGCGVHRAPAARVQRLRPLLAGRQIGRGAAVVRSGHGGEGLPSRGSGGATPCRGAALGGGRDAGIGGFRAQRLTKRFRWLAIET